MCVIFFHYFCQRCEKEEKKMTGNFYLNNFFHFEKVQKPNFCWPISEKSKIQFLFLGPLR